MKEKLLSLIILLLFVSSCTKTKPGLISKSLIGEWRLDSVSGDFKKWDDDYVYITDKNTFWKFTYDSDHYLIDSCLTISENKVLKNDTEVYDIKITDSASFILQDKKGNKFFYRNQDRRFEKDHTQNLKDFIAKDSLHRKINGWWKLTDATWKPVKLINYGNAKNFTMHLGKDGQAAIYINHNIDSLVDYSWETRPEGISMGRLCIAGSRSPVYCLDKNKMKMSFDIKIMDTLTFERCSPLKK